MQLKWVVRLAASAVSALPVVVAAYQLLAPGDRVYGASCCSQGKDCAGSALCCNVGQPCNPPPGATGYCIDGTKCS
jgi:hypothetical protein